MSDAIDDEYHVLLLAGASFYISGETRNEVESFLRHGPAITDILLVETLLGEELAIVGNSVSSIWSSTPDSRRRERAYAARMKGEAHPFGGGE